MILVTEQMKENWWKGINVETYYKNELK